MSQLFSLTTDINGKTGFGLLFSTNKKNTTLAAGVEQHFTVPANYESWEVVFSFEPGATVWVANNQTAAVPGSAFADSTGELNPASRRVKSGDVLSFISNNTTAEIGVSLYAIP